MMPGISFELTAHFDHDASGATNGLHGHGTEEVGNQAADDQTDDDRRIREVEREVNV